MMNYIEWTNKLPEEVPYDLTNLRVTSVVEYINITVEFLANRKLDNLEAIDTNKELMTEGIRLKEDLKKWLWDA